jgi:hypothetical protein
VYSGYGIDPIGSITPAYNNSYIATYLASWGGGVTESPLPGYVSTSNVVINGDDGEISGQYSTSSYAAGVAVTPEFVTGRSSAFNNITSVCLNCPQPPTILFDGNLVIGCGNFQSYELNGTPLNWEIKWGAIDGIPTCTLDNGTLVVGTLIGIINAPGAVIGSNLLYAIGNIDAPVSVLDYYAPLPNNLVGACQVSPISTVIYTITAIGPGGTSTAQVTITIPAQLVCLGITPSAGVTTTLLTCANISTGAALSWFCTGTISQSIDQGIGAVGPVGSLQVYPLTTETWTLTAQPGNITASATVTVDPTLLFPSLDGMINWFEGGENFTAGTYLITCCGGSFQYNNNAGFGINWSDEKTSVDQAFKITTVPGTFNPLPGHAFAPASGEGRYIFDAPGHFVPYSSSAAASTVNAGIAVYYQHNGGPIGIYLNLDSTAGCLPGSMPPTFSLQGPGPDPTITATPSSINAGQTSEVAWGVLNSPTTVTIDNGIGTVTASGSAALTPTLPGDNRVNLTAIGAGGITQSVWTDIWVCGPKPPSSLSFTGAAAGNVIVSWSTTPVTACTQNVLIERSIDGNVFAQIASVALSAGTYTDTTPIPGTTYYYRARSSDAAGNCSPYTVDYSAASILIPSSPVVTLLGGAVPGNGNVASAMISPTGLPFLTWPAVPGATSYNIYKGYSAGNMTIYSTGVTNLFYVDAAANFGVTVYYSVTAVNAGGESAQSAAQSITPARFLSGTGAIYN